MPTLRARVNLRPVERAIGDRIREGLRPVGQAAVDAMREGVDRQFLAEEYRHGRKREAWIPSQRVLLGLGGSPRTLEDTGAYRAAWTGRGAGQRSSVRERSVSVGADAVRFPQVRVFQGQVVTHVAARPIGVPREVQRKVAHLLARHVATGKVARAA